MARTVAALCIGLSLAAASRAAAEESEAEKLAKLRASLAAFQHDEAPSWTSKGGYIEKDPEGNLHFGVGMASLERPFGEEALKTLRLMLITADNRARAEVAKTVSVDVQQTHKKTPQGEEKATRVLSSVTISGVQIIEHYVSKDGKTIYSLARWRYSEEALKKADAFNQQITDYARRNAARAGESSPHASRSGSPRDTRVCAQPYEPSADDFVKRASAVSECYVPDVYNPAWGGAPRSWINRPKKRWTDGTGAERVYFAVGAVPLRAPNDREVSNDALMQAHAHARRRLPRRMWPYDRLLDIHYDGRRLWLLLGTRGKKSP